MSPAMGRISLITREWIIAIMGLCALKSQAIFRRSAVRQGKHFSLPDSSSHRNS